jgi:hypothetical protein
MKAHIKVSNLNILGHLLVDIKGLEGSFLKNATLTLTIHNANATMTNAYAEPNESERITVLF